MLRSDNGGEHNSNEFNAFCAKYKIKRQFTIPYTPQQNGIIKRKNRIIMEMARCMLGNLPSFLWREAVNTTIYTLNRCLTKVFESKTPFEAWSRNKPNISHLRVFGCEAFSYIIFEKIKKLDKRAKKCIFMGYGNQHRGYMLYSPYYRVVFISKDIKFNELPTEFVSNEDDDDLDHSFVVPN